MLTALLLAAGVVATPATKEIALPPWDDHSPALVINVPVAYTVEYSRGPDFDIHSLHRTDDPSKGGRASIYVGHAPNVEDWSNQVTWNIAGKISGQDMAWTCMHPNHVPAITACQAVVRGLVGQVLHLWLSARGAEEAKLLRTALESIHTAARTR